MAIQGTWDVTFTVPNLDKATGFMVEVCGCDVIASFDAPATEGMPSCKSVVLQCGGSGTRIQINQYDGNAVVNIPKNSDVGGWHMAFYVRDIYAAAEKLKGVEGVRVLKGPSLIESGPTKGNCWLYFICPWGVQMEVVNYDDGMAYATGLPTDKIMWRSNNKEPRGLIGSLFVDHIGLTVPDLDAATDVFVEKMGALNLFEISAKGPEDEMDAKLNVHPMASLNLRMFRLGEGMSWEVFQYQSPDQTTNDAKLCEVGGKSFSFESKDIVSDIKCLESGGAVWVSEAGAILSNEGVEEVVGTAPWGGSIRLVSRPKA